MKKLFYLLILLSSFEFCTRNPNEGNTNNKEITDTGKIAFHPTFSDSLKAYKTRRDKTKVDIEDIKKRMAAKPNKNTERSSSNMDRKFNYLNAKLDSMGTNQASSWDKLKIEMDSIFTDMEATIDSLKNEYK